MTQDLGMRVRAESMEQEMLPAPPDGTVQPDGHLPESSPMRGNRLGRITRATAVEARQRLLEIMPPLHSATSRKG